MSYTVKNAVATLLDYLGIDAYSQTSSSLN